MQIATPGKRMHQVIYSANSIISDSLAADDLGILGGISMHIITS